MLRVFSSQSLAKAQHLQGLHSRGSFDIHRNPEDIKLYSSLQTIRSKHELQACRPTPAPSAMLKTTTVLPPPSMELRPPPPSSYQLDHSAVGVWASGVAARLPSPCPGQGSHLGTSATFGPPFPQPLPALASTGLAITPKERAHADKAPVQAAPRQSAPQHQQSSPSSNRLQHTAMCRNSTQTQTLPVFTATWTARELLRHLSATGGATSLGLSLDAGALVSLQEFGFADVVTTDGRMADALGFTELTLYSPQGTATVLHRPTPGCQWTAVGTSMADPQDLELLCPSDLPQDLPAHHDLPTAAGLDPQLAANLPQPWAWAAATAAAYIQAEQHDTQPAAAAAPPPPAAVQVPTLIWDAILYAAGASEQGPAAGSGAACEDELTEQQGSCWEELLGGAGAGGRLSGSLLAARLRRLLQSPATQAALQRAAAAAASSSTGGLPLGHQNSFLNHHLVSS